jgi:PAS domain S-box-containing protein
MKERTMTQTARPQGINEKPQQDLSAEEMLQRMIAELPVGLVLCAMDGRFVQANQAYLDIVGYRLDELVELTYWDITPRKYDPKAARYCRNCKVRGVLARTRRSMSLKTVASCRCCCTAMC